MRSFELKNGKVFHHGDAVTCMIYDVEILDARISINRDGEAFLCQDKVHGAYTPDKFGYQMSWAIGNNADGTTFDSVTHLSLLIEQDYEIF